MEKLNYSKIEKGIKKNLIDKQNHLTETKCENK
jgi:hypothetical protein